MAIKKEDAEGGIREPLVGEKNKHATKEHHPWMVYFTTFIAVCGSYEFGACVSIFSYYYLQ